MTALVTGGAGFIGSHLVEALCARGANVRVLDDLSLGSAQNLSHIKGNIDLIHGTIGNRDLIRKAVHGAELVFHLAAYPSVAYSVEQPEITNQINLDASLALLAEAATAGARRIVFSSSSAVYGERSEPARESDPVNPLSPYALQKYAAERYVLLYSNLRGMPGTALRYFNVFGPRQSFNSPYSGVIARFCTALVSNIRPTLFGAGDQSRDFVSVHDVVQANLLAAEKDAAVGRVFNIGTGKTITVRQLLDALNKANNTNTEPEVQPRRSGEIQFSCADISAAREHLGFSPKVTIDDGLRETLQFYRNEESNNRGV
ncbi:MAG TPA: NAD-dependent epimerase/dehydratase family protein [Verrucomicrobiae bacterium]